MADLWGPASGIQEVINSQHTQAETQALQQQTSEQAGMFPTEKATREVALQQSQLQLQQQQRMIALLSSETTRGKLGPNTSPADMEDELAKLAAEAMNPNEARQHAQTASEIRRNDAYIQETSANADTKMWTTVSNLLGSAKDVASWNTAKALFQQAHPEWMQNQTVQMILKQPYNPNLVTQLQQMSQTQLQRSQTQAADARAARDTANAKSAALKDQRAKVQIQLDKQTLENKKKAGDLASQAKPGDSQAIMDLMKQDYGDDTDEEQASDFRVRAATAAQRMRDLIRQGVTAPTAARQAYAEAKQNGDFDGLKLRGKMGAPSTKERPRSFAPGDKAQANQYYSYGGKTYLFKGGDQSDQKNWEGPL